MCREELLNPGEEPAAGMVCQEGVCAGSTIGKQEGCVPTACALGSWGSTRQGYSDIF